MYVSVPPMPTSTPGVCGRTTPYSDNSTPNLFNPSVNDYSFLTTTQENKYFLHRAKIEVAYDDIILQRAIRFPSSIKFKRTMKDNQLRKLPTKVSEIDRDGAIYITQFITLKVKPVRKRPGHVDKILRFPLPLPTEKECKNISILMDYIFINGQPYFITKLAKKSLHSIQACTGREKV